MESPLFWLVIAGITGLVMMIGDHLDAKDRERFRREAKERHINYLLSPEGRAKMREMDRVIRKHQERTGQIKKEDNGRQE